ncbi:MAG: 50S ribosomal protein L13 [Candidatus Saccharibacteria bacterium]|nr:50S ribosomal protein L13 [Candidatus Saccharibacteria bacterium]
MKTYSAKPAEVNRKWYVLDASQAAFGRVATQAAQLLSGKGKSMYTNHIDCGDYVVIINSDKLVATGKKLDDKIYYRHTNYPGGIKQATLKEKMDKDSTKVLFQAVQGMLPDNKLRAERLKRLKIYTDGNHGHDAQKPQQLKVKEGK